MKRFVVFVALGIGFTAGVFASLSFFRGAVVQSTDRASVGEALEKVMDDCLKKPTAGGSFRCVRDDISSVIDRYGTREVMQALAELNKEGSGFDCHGVAHIVGEVSATASRRGLGETLRQCHSRMRLRLFSRSGSRRFVKESETFR